MSPNWFIGFPVEAEPWYKEVVATVPAGIKYFHPSDLHITFSFLGPVAEKTALQTWQAAVALDLNPVSCSLGKMAPFGDPSRPSAYAFTLDQGRPEIVEYTQHHKNALREVAGQPPEVRPPHPHVTVARPPRDASDALREEGLNWLQKVVPPAISLQVKTMALYTWSDDRKRRQFKIVESLAL